MRHGRGHMTLVGGGGMLVEAGGHRWRQGNIGDSWGMLVGGRKQSREPVHVDGAGEQRWGPVCIDRGWGMKVEAEEHRWGPGNVGGGQGTLVGAGAH